MSVHGWVWSWRRVAAILVCAVAGVVGLAAQAQAATFGIGTGGALAVANPLLAPATSTTGPLTLDPVEGASFTQVMASATCQIIGTPTIDWGDGSTSSGSDTGVGSISGTHTYTEEGTYTATVTWTESCLTIRGSVPTDPTQTDTIHVSDAFLSAQGSPVNATVGSPFTGQVATFTDSDPNPNLTAADYTASIDWGDGTVSTGRISPNPSGGYQVTGSHTYAAPPTGLIVATISDRGPEGGVADQPHSTVTASTNPNVALVEAEGQQFTGQLANANCTVTSTPTINWQDGTQDSGTASGGGLIDGTHAYAEEGSYTVIVTWHDDCHDGLVTSTTTINVSDTAPNVTVSTVNVTAGSQFSGQVATFSDPAPEAASHYVATINWGDGTTTAGTVSGTGPFVVNGTHTYATPGSPFIQVEIIDDPATTFAFSQANVSATTPPTVSGISPSSGPATGGTAVTITGAHFTGVTGVSFGSTAATSFKLSSDTSLTATSPPGTGKVDVTVTTASGTSPTSSSDVFSYVPSGSSASGGGGGAGGAGGGAGATTAPSLTPGAPAVVSTTSAAFTATVNPEGLATSVTFDYGPELAAARDVGFGSALRNSAVTYTATTPAQSVGPDFSSHQVSATVTGLLPNTTYDVRVVASNTAGTTLGPNQTLTTPADPAPGPPVLGQSFDASPVAGLVLVRLPHGAPLYSRDVGAHALVTGNGFLPLTEARQLPSGTQIDARLGTIKLVTATTQRHKTQTGNFSSGLFGLSQSRHGANKGLTTLSLLEGLFAGAPSFASCTAKKASDHSYAYAAGLSSAVLQTLHSSAHGRFRTRGRYSAATVRGTIWTTTDRCDGTLTSVQKDTVLVTDFVHHKTILLHAGQHYLAKARK